MTLGNSLASILLKKPHAQAYLNASSKYPNIKGTVRFFQTNMGVIVASEVTGLPSTGDKCKSPIFAFHIHSGESCSGNLNDEFANTGVHYNPQNCPHPYHAGDLPPLFSNDGYAFEVTLTNRFTVSEIIGKTAVIHSMPDDFKTQPSGDSGEKIACGEIKLF